MGIAIGPAAIVSLLGASQGFSNSVTEQFDRLGVTTIQVITFRGNLVTQQDIEAIEGIPEVGDTIPYYSVNANLGQPTQVIAIDITKLQVLFQDIDISQGNLPDNSAFTSAVVGSALADPPDEEISPISLSQVIAVTTTLPSQIRGVPPQTTTRAFLVQGILTEFGQGLFISPDDTVFVPLNAGRLLTGTLDYNGLFVIAANPEAVNEVAEAISEILGNNVRVITISSILSTVEGITSTISTLLASVASISIAVAFMGIMTTMFTSVNERTREIGIAKALGYSSRTVMQFFLAEAVLVGFIGGIVGAAAGVVLSSFLTSFFGGGLGFPGGGGGFGRGGPGGGGGGGGGGGIFASLSETPATLTPVIIPELLVGAILLATAVGVLAGLIPAWRASRLTPVEALRHE